MIYKDTYVGTEAKWGILGVNKIYNTIKLTLKFFTPARGHGGITKFCSNVHILRKIPKKKVKIVVLHYCI